MRLSGLVVLLGALAGGCVTHPISAPVGERSGRPANNPAYHSVKQGDTLYSVAFLYGLSVEDVAAWNALKPPYTIYKRQRLRLSRPPRARVAPPPKPPAPKVAASKPKPRYTTKPVVIPRTPAASPSRPKTTAPVVRRAPQPAPAQTPARAEPAARPDPNKPVLWSWPAEGRLLRRFSASSSGKKGINIAGQSGQRVLAAAAGKVVYSGSGLGGYGRLIIVKHNKDFLSAYAHNRKLIAKEGQWVKKGEVIAWMGSSGTDRVQLHFEIRKRGKPVDPLRYLPRR